MPTESVVFSPEIPDRELDREASKVDKRLAESGQIQPEIGDVQGEMDLSGSLGGVSGAADTGTDLAILSAQERTADQQAAVAAEATTQTDLLGGVESEVTALRKELPTLADPQLPGGEGDIVDVGGGVGGAAAGAGAQGGAAAGLASRIPKPISGVTAGAALPIAITGAIGVGLLGAMQNASARMQTSTKLLGQAWNNVFRPIGDRVDELFIRDVAQDLVSATQGFEDSFNSLSDNPVASFTVSQQVGTAVSNTIVEEMTGVDLMERVETFQWPTLPSFSWPELPSFPDWPDINADWPGWPSVDTEWPGWPTINPPEWPTINPPEWPDINPPNWPTANDILAEFPSLSVDDLRDTILGDGPPEQTATMQFDGSQPTDSGGGTFEGIGPSSVGFGIGEAIRDRFDGYQRGGVINRPTPVMAGEAGPEVITPVAELRRMMEGVAQQQGGGGDSGGVDREAMRPVENKLDRLNRNITQLAQAMQSMSVEVDKETLGRMASEGQREDVTDTDPLVR